MYSNPLPDTTWRLCSKPFPYQNACDERCSLDETINPSTYLTRFIYRGNQQQLTADRQLTIAFGPSDLLTADQIPATAATILHSQKHVAVSRGRRRRLNLASINAERRMHPDPSVSVGVGDEIRGPNGGRGVWGLSTPERRSSLHFIVTRAVCAGEGCHIPIYTDRWCTEGACAAVPAEACRWRRRHRVEGRRRQTMVLSSSVTNFQLTSRLTLEWFIQKNKGFMSIVSVQWHRQCPIYTIISSFFRVMNEAL